jgi:hypothetical protein
MAMTADLKGQKPVPSLEPQTQILASILISFANAKTRDTERLIMEKLSYRLTCASRLEEKFRVVNTKRTQSPFSLSPVFSFFFPTTKTNHPTARQCLALTHILN